MFQSRRLITAGILATLLFGLSLATSWSDTPVQGSHSKYTAQQKQESNSLISAAITLLTQAQSALGSGNAAQASSDLTGAISDLTQALPIYHGYRVKAIGSAKRALRQLSHPKVASNAPQSITQAITDANTALQNVSDNTNEGA
jgi:hypothetical protein